MDGELQYIKYFNPTTSYWQTSAPTFPYNNQAGLRCTAKNISSQTLYFYMYWYGWNAFGHREWQHTTDTFQLSPGGTLTDEITFFCNREGTYKASCQLYVWGETTPEDSVGSETSGVDVAYVTGGPEAVGIISRWRFWDDVEKEWVLPGPTAIPLGSDIGVQARGRNEDPDGIPGPAQDMRIDVKVYPPGEDSYLLTGDTIHVSAGGYHDWEFLWEADGAGDWYADIILYAGPEEVARRQDDEVAHVVTEGPPPPPEGTITTKQLKYDSTERSIPASGVPIGTSGIVTVLGRNDMDTAQRMGIEWTVEDPDGLVVEHYGPVFEAWPYTSPGDEHKFDGGRFDIDKEGIWTIDIELLMDPDDPVVVDSYTGRLCTVEEAPEEAGAIIKKELDIDDEWQTIPVTVGQGTKTRVRVTTENTGTTKYHPTCRWVIKDPQGGVWDDYINTAIDLNSPDETQEFNRQIWETKELDKVGDYTIEIWFYSSETGNLLDQWEGVLCTVGITVEELFANLSVTYKPI